MGIRGGGANPAGADFRQFGEAGGMGSCRFARSGSTLPQILLRGRNSPEVYLLGDDMGDDLMGIGWGLGR